MSSDEEVPPTGGMDEDMGDMSGDDDMDYTPPNELPEGIKKEILTAASSENWKKPKKGDEVHVHYVGTLESDGSEFDSSRGRGQPFTFTLGSGQVIKGWDLGVATMKKGELAKFTLAPEFAYGDSGSPPKIPEKATLVFEVELLSWTSKDDLFNDEGVIKTMEKEGSGWKTPKDGGEVNINIGIKKADGSVLVAGKIADEGFNGGLLGLNYVIGSGNFGEGAPAAACAKAIDKALTGMKKDEQVTLACSKDYADGLEGGATVKLALNEIYEIKDVSFGKDKTMMKKQVREGEGYNTPKEGAKCKVLIEVCQEIPGQSDATQSIPNAAGGVREFTLGNGEACDAVEQAVAEMKKKEEAVLTVTTPKLCEDPPQPAQFLGLRDLETTHSVKIVRFKLVLEEFENPKETYDMSEEEKVQFGQARKDVGASLFKAGRINLAVQRYKKVVDMFNYIDNYKDETMKQKAKDLKKVCELNKAACYLKLLDYAEAKKACATVLKDESGNVKALYRQAQAELGLKNFAECIRDCKRVVEIDAQNKEARALLKQAQVGQKEEDKKSKGLFANMCKALGKGPIPEPYKAKRPYEDDMDDDDDAPMDDAGEEPAETEGAAEKKDAEMASAEESKPADTGA